VTDLQITLLAADLRKLAGAMNPSRRLPALERVFSRGDECRIDCLTADHLRFALFAIEPGGALPVAALTHLSDRKRISQGSYFWLRADPVTMWADMAKVFMTSYGFADLDPYERNEIENCIRMVLLEEGIDFHSDHPERWCIALSKPLDFEFTPLDDALGMDVADALPGHPEALFWRRILNEIQVALHHCPVNIRRRQSGRQEVNSVWFWGGGFIPDPSPGGFFRTVYSDSAVTRGLAIIHDCRLNKLDLAGSDVLSDQQQSVLIDWTPATRNAEAEIGQLDILVKRTLDQVEEMDGVLTVLDGSGQGVKFDRKSRRRFWRRKTPLSSLLTHSGRP